MFVLLAVVLLPMKKPLSSGLDFVPKICWYSPFYVLR